ncbi:D-arabinono-1,4-lactone oxidase [Paenarthrobacter nicotinovorans]|uniref:D-arabinono-1,4-lactone oxidase n=1 Tax=Paenarthrobacter nicotinovorans TaxID=29320 RepID=UPI00374881FA
MTEPKPFWQNWGLNQSCEPNKIITPSTAEEAATQVAEALKAGRSVRAAGSGHSVMPIVPTDGVLLDPSRLSGITDIDSSTGRVTMLSGTQLRDLGAPLWEAGLGLGNQGDIDIQTIVGATATGTKGSGVDQTNLSAKITRTDLVTGTGEHVSLDSGDELAASKVALGLLGIITQVQVQMVPRYFLRETNRIMHYQELIEGWEELKKKYRHFSFWWMPNERAHSLYGFEPVPSDHAYVKLLEEVEIDDSFDVRHTPEGRIGRSYLVYPDTTTDPEFHELEYMLPADRDEEGFLAMRDLMMNHHQDIDSPVQIRWQKQDDAWLSPQYGRETVSVSVSGVIGTDYEPFLREVNGLLQPMDARPHWGKINYYGQEDFAAVYPKWDDFRRLREKFDPEGLLANDYLKKSFGIS